MFSCFYWPTKLNLVKNNSKLTSIIAILSTEWYEIWLFHNTNVCKPVLWDTWHPEASPLHRCKTPESCLNKKKFIIKMYGQSSLHIWLSIKTFNGFKINRQNSISFHLLKFKSACVKFLNQNTLLCLYIR